MRKKGTEKTGGRQKGTPNKTTAALRHILTQRVAEYYQEGGDFDKDLQQLNAKERAYLFEKLTKFAAPTLQSVEANITEEEKDPIKTIVLQRLQMINETAE